MLKKSLKFIGFFLIILGIFIIIANPIQITGAVINTRTVLDNPLFFIGLGAILIGTILFVLVKEPITMPSKLLVYVPNECIEKGIIPGGSDPNEQVVSAFNPEKFTPKQIRESFDFGGERSLVEIVGDSKRKFHPRLTGPDQKPHGIYASEEYIPANDLKVVGEDYDILR